MCHTKQEQASQLIKYQQNVSCHINDTWIRARRSKFESQDPSAFLTILITVLYTEVARNTNIKSWPPVCYHKRFSVMPAAASFFLARTTRKPGKLRSTHGTPVLSLCSIQAHTHATGTTQLDNPSFSLQIVGMMWRFAHSGYTHTFSRPEALCLHGHPRFCAGTQAHMAMHWGETGNMQPELNAGTSLSGAVWAHIKLKPVTKLYLN